VLSEMKDRKLSNWYDDLRSNQISIPRSKFGGHLWKVSGFY
jgi:hypothetical protein